MNIIAALTSTGDFIYSVNCGKTNGHTFGFFLMKLCQQFDSEDLNWRKNTILMLDNAGYHRGVIARDIMEKLHLPVLYLGPYHFRMALVEMAFNFIKNHDLNPLVSKVRSRYDFLSKYVEYRLAHT